MKPQRKPPIYCTAEPLHGYPKPIFGLTDNPHFIVSSWGGIYPNTPFGRFRYGYRRFYKETRCGKTLKTIMIAELIIGAVMILSNMLFRESYHAQYLKRTLNRR